VKVLFLDIDGVLNGHEYDAEAESCNIRRECVKRLSRVVKETGCKIVISSAWRYMIHGGAMTLTGFAYMLRTHGLIGITNIVGYTEKDAETPGDENDERARQCLNWLNWWKNLPGDGPVVSAFAAVDDIDFEWARHGIPAVVTSGAIGLTDADADRLIELLGKIDK